jgi:hypothetical protein
MSNINNTNQNEIIKCVKTITFAKNVEFAEITKIIENNDKIIENNDKIIGDNNETIEDNETNEIDFTENVFLPDNFSIYYHDCFDKDWSKESYKELYKIDTIQNFWRITKLITDKVDMGMFFLFREHIFPLWDDELNENGGALSMKVLKTDAYACWEDLTTKFVSDNLLKEYNADLYDEINGITSSAKKTFCILKIWLKSDKLSNPEKFNIFPRYHGSIIYKSHKEANNY